MRVIRAAGLAFAFTTTVAPQPVDRLFVPVGVVNDSPSAFGSRADLEYLRTLRFNVIARPDRSAPDGMRVETLASLLAPERGGSPNPISIGALEVMSSSASARRADVRRSAWMAIGRGLRGVLFSWSGLRQTPDALAAAATFADNVTRNAALFAPLQSTTREIKLDVSPSIVFARFAESADALVLVAANLTDATQTVTMTFATDVPEAIWQNMETGGSVHFVTGREGPAYNHTFPPADVVVLMIRKSRGQEN